MAIAKNKQRTYVKTHHTRHPILSLPGVTRQSSPVPPQAIQSGAATSTPLDHRVKPGDDSKRA
jgi:hypothetical protein